MNNKLKLSADILAFITLVSIVFGAVFLSLKHDTIPERVKKTIQLENGQIHFSFYDINHKKYSFSDFRGNLVLVNLWATWCAPCVEELPSLIKLSKKIKKLKVIIISDESKEAVQSFLSSFEKPPKNFIVGFHPDALDIFSTEALPETFIFNKEGFLIEKVIGPRDWNNPGWMSKLEEFNSN